MIHDIFLGWYSLKYNALYTFFEYAIKGMNAFNKSQKFGASFSFEKDILQARSTTWENFSLCNILGDFHHDDMP